MRDLLPGGASFTMRDLLLWLDKSCYEGLNDSGALLNIQQLPFFDFRMCDHFSEVLDQQKLCRLSIMAQPGNLSLILIIKQSWNNYLL